MGCASTKAGCEMIIFDEDRPSDSPFVERVWRCHSEGAAPFLSIAASRCELVVSRLQGKVTMTMPTRLWTGWCVRAGWRVSRL
jgi:hypothetical protein